MEQYLDLLEIVVNHGVDRGDRTRTGTRSIFGHQMRFNLREGFPLVTTKQVNLRAVIYELLWFLAGDTNVAYLKDHGVHIWDEWADENGDLGPVYGAQWRRWVNHRQISFHKEEADRGECPYYFGAIDQIKQLLDSLQNNPESRRHIVTAWNPAEVDEMKLPPCHCLFQFYVANNRLSCQLYQRSADLFLGVPFNIASYALLTHMIADQVGMQVGDFVWTGGDCHIYHNHFDQVGEQLGREPHPLPSMHINPFVPSLFEYQYDDFELRNYQHHPAIRGEVAV